MKRSGLTRLVSRLAAGPCVGVVGSRHDMARYEVVSDREVPSGPVEIRCEFLNETRVPGDRPRYLC